MDTSVHEQQSEEARPPQMEKWRELRKSLFSQINVVAAAAAAEAEAQRAAEEEEEKMEEGGQEGTAEGGPAEADGAAGKGLK